MDGLDFVCEMCTNDISVDNDFLDGMCVARDEEVEAMLEVIVEIFDPRILN